MRLAIPWHSEPRLFYLTARITGGLFREGLDCYLESELGIPRTPYFTHSPLAQKADDFVMAEFGARFHRYCVSLKVS